MKRTIAVLVALLVLAAGCGVEDLPDDEAFASCLESAGLDPDDLGGADERREAFADPAALDCVVDLDEPADQRAVLAGVFEDDREVWPVMREWVAAQEGSPEVVGRDAGALLGAVDGEEDDDFGEAWSEEQVNENVAWEIYRQSVGEPASYQVWLEDEAAQRSVSESDPLSGASQFLNWLEEPGNGGQGTAVEIRELQDAVRRVRQD